MASDIPGPDNGIALKATTLTFAVVSTLLAMWRFTYRAKRKLLSWSDAFLLVGLCVALSQAGINVGAYMDWGYGHKKANIPEEILTSKTPKLIFWVNQILFKISAGSVKMSICIVYLGIFRRPIALGVKIAQAGNFVTIGVVGCYYLGATMVSTFQCSPISHNWDPVENPTCIDNDRFRIANASMNIITSVALIALPFPALLSVERRSRDLWQFLFLVGLGLIHTMCAVWRLILMYLPPPATPDPYWNNTTSNTLAMTEIFVAIIAATIIVMQPCFKMFGSTVSTTLANSTFRRGAGDSSKGTMSKSRGNTGSALVTQEGKSKDRDRFRRIAVTTEIELESRDKSTEDLVESGMRSVYIEPGKGRAL